MNKQNIITFGTLLGLKPKWNHSTMERWALEPEPALSPCSYYPKHGSLLSAPIKMRDKQYVAAQMHILCNFVDKINTGTQR